MKKYLTGLFVLLLLGTITGELSAQNALSKDPIVRKLDRVLDLSDAQESQVLTALKNSRSPWTRAQMQNMSEDERAAAKKSMRQTFVDSVESILTSEQSANFARVKARLIP